MQQVLADGSYLSTIRPTRREPRRGRRAGHHGARDRVRAARRGRRAAALPAADDAAGSAAGAGDGAGGAVPPALGDRGRLRRAQDAPAAEPAGAAQQDAGAGAPGVLRLGAGALRGALAAAPRRHAAPNTARRAVLQGTCAAAPARTAPIRGLSPQSGPDDAQRWFRELLEASASTARHQDDQPTIATHGQAPKLAVRAPRPNRCNPSPHGLHAASGHRPTHPTLTANPAPEAVVTAHPTGGFLV